ncbi:hypothetical protein AX17_006594, partial [Amanita inopinata Kibby_2008]
MSNTSASSVSDSIQSAHSPCSPLSPIALAYPEDIPVHHSFLDCVKEFSKFIQTPTQATLIVDLATSHLDVLVIHLLQIWISLHEFSNCQGGWGIWSFHLILEDIVYHLVHINANKYLPKAHTKTIGLIFVCTNMGHSLDDFQPLSMNQFDVLMRYNPIDNIDMAVAAAHPVALIALCLCAHHEDTENVLEQEPLACLYSEWLEDMPPYTFHGPTSTLDSDKENEEPIPIPPPEPTPSTLPSEPTLSTPPPTHTLSTPPPEEDPEFALANAIMQSTAQK